MSSDKSSGVDAGKGKMANNESTPARTPPKAPPIASPSMIREKSLQGSLEAKIRGMNTSPTAPPNKLPSEIKSKSSAPSSEEATSSSSSIPSYLQSTAASRRQRLEKEGAKPASEVKCEACGWSTSEIGPSTDSPIREKRCAMCKARHLKYTGSSPAKAHKGGNH